jgi:MFS family permease
MWKKLSPDQKQILIILALMNFINYLDRQVIFPLFGAIKAEFLLVHSLFSLPLGLLADKYSRKYIIAAGVFFWSFATFFGGLAKSFHQLLVARGFVGLGEASYSPAATAMITDNFDQSVRGRAQGLFNVGMFFGGTIGGMIGGLLFAYYQTWRIAFVLVSIPGIILAFFALKIKDRRVEHTEPKVSPLSLFKNLGFLWMLTGGVLISFAAGGLAAWCVEFVVRFKGYSLRDASIFLGLNLMVAGVLGVLVGSYLADYFQKKYRSGRNLVVAISMLVGAPLFYLGLQDMSITWLPFVFFFLGLFFTSFYHGPAIVVLHDIVPKQLRASSVALYFLICHLLGDAAAPAILGRISDMYNLKLGMEIAVFAIFLGGLSYLPVAYLIVRGKLAVHKD